MKSIAGITIVVLTFGFVSIASTSTAIAGGPKTLKLGDVQLRLNGSGYRKKSLLSLYEGSLYLQQRTRDAAKIVSAEAPNEAPKNAVHAARLRSSVDRLLGLESVMVISYRSRFNGRRSRIASALRCLKPFAGCSRTASSLLVHMMELFSFNVSLQAFSGLMSR